MKLKPLFDRVVILPRVEESKTKLGLVLPQTSQERPEIGTVVYVGDGENFDYVKTEMKVKVGDVVVFSKYAGTELKIEEKTYIVLRQIDIIGVLDERENNS